MTAAPYPPADHLDRIMAVMLAAFDPLYGEAWTRRQVGDALLIGQCHYRLIADDGSEPGGDPTTPDFREAGFALLRTALDEEELLLLAVSPAHRRKGLGATLLRSIIADARARGVCRMLLEMRRGNPAEALYRAHGFVEIGCRPNYYRTMRGDRLDAITFALTLAND